jgi:HlyD family secretion protein
MALRTTSLWLLSSLLVIGALAIVLDLVPLKQPKAAPRDERKLTDDTIGCLGQIEPGDGIMRLGARSLSGQPAIVAKLLVAERDEVKPNQIVAELDSAAQLRATSELGEARVQVTRQRLRQAEAGAKPADIAAQQAEIDRIDAELENARTELRRQDELLQGNAATQSAVDSARLRVDTLTSLRRQGVSRLTGLSEVRAVDVDVAKAELEAAVREVVRARAEYEASLIRSPLQGRVIKIHAWPGEEVGQAGVMEVAATDRMYVLAELAESDMARVRPGQRATITGHGLPMTLKGAVETVGLQVMQNSILKLDPAEFSDARVVEAKIRLDEGERVAHLLHLRVNVSIEAPRASEAREGR